jgi:hypothetical protein
VYFFSMLPFKVGLVLHTDALTTPICMFSA